jgi:hypothetical protein
MPLCGFYFSATPQNRTSMKNFANVPNIFHGL